MTIYQEKVYKKGVYWIGELYRHGKLVFRVNRKTQKDAKIALEEKIFGKYPARSVANRQYFANFMSYFTATLLIVLIIAIIIDYIY